ncbi:F-box protein CPR1-like [Papaver somniferum]|uniref:F-box protein CPR1-like n=1 Tax=Papaver somniferum TaxID=3469 RepID=UPI000E6F7069|nr:F-box protein CPR1-like [Papaver somniferum]
MSISISSAPEDISQEILLRLPVKSLLRSKSISKYFNFLIRSSNFIKKHLNHSIQKNNVTFIFPNYDLRETQFISLNPLLDSPSAKPDGFVTNSRHFSFIKSGWKIDYFCGSSNGLLCVCCINTRVSEDLDEVGCCLSDDDDIKEEQIFVLNPSTREFKKILVPRRVCNRGIMLRSLFWFDYDCKIDDYKVVRVVDFGGSGKESFEVEVYTLGSDSWKRIGNVSYKFEKHHGVLVSGALHWFAVSSVQQLKVLVSLDIVNERFVEVLLPKERLTYPEEPLEDVKYVKNVGELGGRLCLLFHVFGVRVDLWVMQEYGVRDSWTKSFTIIDESITKTCSLSLKWNFVDNRILLQADDKLILYDPKSERCRKLTDCESNKDAVNYVTSLVSLNSGRYFKQRKTKKRKRWTMENLTSDEIMELMIDRDALRDDYY